MRIGLAGYVGYNPASVLCLGGTGMEYYTVGALIYITVSHTECIIHY